MENNKEMVYVVPKSNFNAEGGEELGRNASSVDTNNGATIALLPRLKEKTLL